MRHARFHLAAFLLWSLAPPAHASSVVPLGFDEIVGEARSIVRAQVVEVRAVRGPAGRIDTLVTFRVERVLKGPADRALATLRFAGGAIGDESMEVAGMPRFAAGDRDLLCLGDEDGVLSPVVGLMQGRFRVVRGLDGVDRVTRHDGAAFATTAQILQPLRASTAPVRTMDLDHFESAIARHVAAVK
jgi:hypothetical protein